MSKVWEYLKANKLQNPDDGREIIADDKLRRIFGNDRATMFEKNKSLAQHFKSARFIDLTMLVKRTRADGGPVSALTR